MVKINDEITDKITAVHIDPVTRPGSNNKNYSGRLIGDNNYFNRLVSMPPFTLEYNNKTYYFCDVTNNPTPGNFIYSPDPVGV